MKHIGVTRKQTGFTLIEVLIAVVVLSIGLLGVAAMQFVGLRDSNKSNERSLATVLAYDIADRMRANPQATAAGNYLITAGTAPTTPTITSPSTPQDFCKTDFTGTTVANICSSTEMATADKYDWYTTVQNTLPGGLGQVTCTDANVGDASPCSAGSTFTITVMWDDLRNGATGTGCDPDDIDDMLCMSLTTEI